MEIPIEYLLDASGDSLEGIELKNRDLAATLKKEARMLDAEAERHLATAELANWLRVNRLELLFVRAQSVKDGDVRQLYIWKNIAPSKAEGDAGLAMILDQIAAPVPVPALAAPPWLRRKSA